MIVEGQEFVGPAPARSEVQLVRSEHGHIAQLLLVLESHLTLMIMGERFDGAAMLDAVDHLIDYAGEFHRAREEHIVAAMTAEQPAARSCAAILSAQRDVLEMSGAELYHRLDLAIRYESINRGEVVRLGYTYCTELRNSISIGKNTRSEERPMCTAPGTNNALLSMVGRKGG